ncbi:hypothetical protein [Delftia sp. ASV31]|uniref:hypothetical protein n=1 Tax=Delftia sp. ASV31 TaxID=2795113 RepID=UPI001E443794|nr:hypothetical protein [Delftia sp. ASV31]
MDAALNPLQPKAEPDARIAEMMKTEKAGAVEEVRAQVHECQLTEQNMFPDSGTKAKSFVAMPRFRAPPPRQVLPGSAAASRRTGSTARTAGNS